MTRFRRAFIDRKLSPPRVGIETGEGVIYLLPNPGSDGRVYDADRLLPKVIEAQEIMLERWVRMP